MKNKIILALLLCVSVAFLSGCGKETPSTENAQNQEQEEFQGDDKFNEYYFRDVCTITAPGKSFTKQPIKDINFNGVKGKEATLNDDEVSIIVKRFEKSAFKDAGKEVPTLEAFTKEMLPKDATTEKIEVSYHSDYNGFTDNTNHYYVTKESATALGVAEVVKNPWNPFASPMYAELAKIK